MKKTKKTLNTKQKMWKALRSNNRDPNPFDSIIMPMVRKFVPQALANDIVSVQPMSLPEGTTYEGIAKGMEDFLNRAYDEESKKDED